MKPAAREVFYTAMLRWGVGLVVFDMAGTTVQDDGMVLECFVAAAEYVGLRVSREELNDRMGLSKIAVFDELSRRQVGPGRDEEKSAKARASAPGNSSGRVMRSELSATFSIMPRWSGSSCR